AGTGAVAFRARRAGAAGAHDPVYGARYRQRGDSGAERSQLRAADRAGHSPSEPRANRASHADAAAPVMTTVGTVQPSIHGEHRNLGSTENTAVWDPRRTPQSRIHGEHRCSSSEPVHAPDGPMLQQRHVEIQLQSDRNATEPQV